MIVDNRYVVMYIEFQLIELVQMFDRLESDLKECLMAQIFQSMVEFGIKSIGIFDNCCR